MLNHDKLVCLLTGEEFTDDGNILQNPNAPAPSFLRPRYKNKSFEVRDNLPGLYRFSNWLPIDRILKGSSAPVTYKSEALADHLGLHNLYITFNGYWPEKGARMTTGTFKECEAYSVCARMPKESQNTLVVASAGNTARAFIKVCSQNKIPLVVVVPEKNLKNIWSVEQVDPCVRLIAAGGDCDYLDAINLSGMICSLDGYQNEGGAKNVARRDGMATTVLSAVDVIGQIPDYYFQAIGSGTGAIAAYESNLRLIGSGAFGGKKMSLQVSQNEPFVPIYDAWQQGSDTIAPMDEAVALGQIDEIIAKVLSNRKPPYSPKGGLYEALKETDGDVITVSNDKAREAMTLFEELEGCSICPEGGVALGSLISKIQSGAIKKDAIMMLNITGGGLDRIERDFDVQPVKPTLIIDKKEFDPSALAMRLKI